MKFVQSVLVIGLGCLPALAQVNSPKIGTARYPDGSLHSVFGIPDNMVVSIIPVDTVEVSSFSNQDGLVETNGMIRLVDPKLTILGAASVYEKPVLSIQADSSSALAWLPIAHILLHWNGTQFQPVPVAGSDISGIVTDLQMSGTTQARLIVQHSDNSVSAAIVSLSDGSLVTETTLPSVTGNTAVVGTFLAYFANKQLIADNLSGDRRTVPFTVADAVFEHVSSNWLHLYSPSLQQHWALHLTASDMHLSLLPGLPSKPAATNVAKPHREER